MVASAESNKTVVLVQEDQFLDRIDQLFTQRLRERNLEDLKESFYSPQQARKLFNPTISLVTLDAWAEKGLITKHRIGGRVYYRYSELIDAITRVKKYSRSTSVAA